MRNERWLKAFALLAAVLAAVYLVIYTLLVTPRRFWRCMGEPLRFFTRRFDGKQSAPLPALQSGHRLRLLVNGNEALPMLLELISDARESIRWQVMLFAPDHAGRELADALARAALRGVTVQLSFHIEQTVNGSVADFYSPAKKRQRSRQIQAMLARLGQAGVEVRSNPPAVDFPPRDVPSEARAVQVEIDRHVSISGNHYDHRKMLIVDGRRAWMGGMNVGDHYLYHISPNDWQDMQAEADERQRAGLPEAWPKWFDTSLVLEGPLVAELAAEFDWRWQVLGGSALPHVVPQPATLAGGSAAQLLRQRPGLYQVGARFFDLVGAARQEIFVASPFVSYGPALEALQAAARRGVRVVFVYPNAHQEMGISGRIFRQAAGELAEAGVELYFNDLRMAHTKLMVVDGQDVLLGSFNLNHRSFRHDLEIALLAADQSFAREVIDRVFQPYLALSRRVVPAEAPWNPILWWVEPFT